MMSSEYSCVNAFMKIPFEIYGWKSFMSEIEAKGIIHQIEYYITKFDSLNYTELMEDLISTDKCVKLEDLNYENSVPYNVEFKVKEIEYRLVTEFYDKDYYGIALVTNKRIVDMDLVKCFYNSFKPICGNIGIEKAMKSLSCLNINDKELFSEGIMLSNNVFRLINNNFFIRYIERVVVNDGVIFIKNGFINRYIYKKAIKIIKKEKL